MLDEKALLGRGWGVYGRTGGQHKEEHRRLYHTMRDSIQDILEPRIMYGFFRCHARGESLYVEGDSGTLAFAFPRSRRSGHLCISDYFGSDDVVAFQACTAGPAANRTVSEWTESGRTTDAYYLNGLITEFVEAMAEWTNVLIRGRMGLSRGCRRYSWGYTDCPDVAQHRLVWDILRPDRIGMKLTPSCQISPDLSTVAMVVHHPDAKWSR